nr:pyridoxal-phosphate dependent enzyme [Litorivivens lipolytica]
MQDERLGNTRLWICRLDLLAGPATGNKWFKLLPNLRYAQSQGIRRVASFGGVWSNHLDALARAGAAFGLSTVGFVRGYADQPLTPMLRDARAQGMELVFLSRSDYRRRNDPQFLASLCSQYPETYWVPEGGSNCQGVAGCRLLGEELGEELGKLAVSNQIDKVALACGTGGSLAGIAQGLAECGAAKAVGYAVLKPGDFLREAVREYQQQAGGVRDNWSIVTDYHGGGYARCGPELQQFIEDFYLRHKIPLDPLYTGKLMWGLFQDIALGKYAGEGVLALHTGGLQGLRGYPDLLANLTEMGFQGL